jgi:hypothetical protein
MFFEPSLKPRKIEGYRPFDQFPALRPFLLFRNEERSTYLGADIFHSPHHLVAQRSLPGVGRVKIRQLAYIAINGIRLRNDLSIHFKHRQSTKWGIRLAALPLPWFNPIIFKRDSADREGKSCGFSTSSVKVKVGKSQLGHDPDSHSVCMMSNPIERDQVAFTWLGEPFALLGLLRISVRLCERGLTDLPYRPYASLVNDRGESHERDSVTLGRAAIRQTFDR